MEKVRLSGSSVASVHRGSPLDYPAVNKHVLVCGSSGSGKSYLAHKLFPSPEGLVLFKPDSIFGNIPLATDIGLPDPFRFAPYDVADAYLYALGLNMSGIMASSLVPVLMDVVSSSMDFKQFYARLADYAEEGVTRSVCSLIRSHFDTLYPFWVARNGRPPTRNRIVPLTEFRISFAGMGNFRAEFGAELFLRGLYSSLGSKFGSLLIDEFHHVARAGSVVDALLREFRVSGRLIAISQSLSDVDPGMISNFGYILVSRSVHAGDLAFLARLHGDLPALVSHLPARVFLSLSEYLDDPSTGALPLYRWIY